MPDPREGQSVWRTTGRVDTGHDPPHREWERGDERVWTDDPDGPTDEGQSGVSAETPEFGSVRWFRAFEVLFSGRYDDLKAPDARDLIDGVTSDEELDRKYPIGALD